MKSVSSLSTEVESLGSWAAITSIIVAQSVTSLQRGPICSKDEPYAIREEDVPIICEEYDKLAKLIIERRKEFWLTEKYGFTMNNDYIDNLNVNDIVDKGTKYNKCYNY